ncbi:nuclear pore glycoprotein p62-like [Setaria italica]|uniref:nuclear pore glycoprotein p62-like n=1 Tax=Setaria italica TaxID=4555 RepID=UPI000350FA6A|nr:nuclear pore glycoprotein p62-like [Setaria italica]
MGTAAATEEGVLASAAAAEEAAATEVGTSTPEVPAEVAPAAEAEVSARGASAGVEEPASAVAAEGEVATGILVPPPALEAVAPSGGSAAAPTVTGAQAPGPSANPAASGMMEPASTAASGLAPASALATSVPRVWRWLSKNAVAAAQGVINDLQGHEQAAQEDVRRSEAKLQAVVDKAQLDHEELQAATAEKACLDAEELGRLRGDLDALQKTVERIRREWQKAWQERDFEAARKNEAEKMAAELGAEVGQLRAQVQGLQTAVSQGPTGSVS